MLHDLVCGFGRAVQQHFVDDIEYFATRSGIPRLDKSEMIRLHERRKEGTKHGLEGNTHKQIVAYIHCNLIESSIVKLQVNFIIQDNFSY